MRDIKKKKGKKKRKRKERNLITSLGGTTATLCHYSKSQRSFACSLERTFGDSPCSLSFELTRPDEKEKKKKKKKEKNAPSRLYSPINFASPRMNSPRKNWSRRKNSLIYRRVPSAIQFIRNFRTVRVIPRLISTGPRSAVQIRPNPTRDRSRTDS